jgi:hypothetical protein
MVNVIVLSDVLAFFYQFTPTRQRELQSTYAKRTCDHEADGGAE